MTAESPRDVIPDSDVIMMADNDVIDVDTEGTSGQQQQADTTFILNQEVPCVTERKLTLMSEILNERHGMFFTFTILLLNFRDSSLVEWKK